MEIIEEGLVSRTITSEDRRPGKEGRRGESYLAPCLDSHDPLDLVIAMLGTNELKAQFDRSPDEIANDFGTHIVRGVLTRKSQFRNTFPKLLIVAPPIVDDTRPYAQRNYKGATPKSQLLSAAIKQVADLHNCAFVDASGIVVGPDGVHLSAEGHAALAKMLAKEVVQMKVI